MKKSVVVTILLALVVSLSCPAFAAGKKGLMQSVTLKKTTNEVNNEDAYSFHIGPQKTTKLKKDMTFSAVMLIPTGFLRKGNLLQISSWVSLHQQGLEGDDYVGYVPGSDDLFLMNNEGNIQVFRSHVFRINLQNSYRKMLPAGSMCTVKKAGKYYRITINGAGFQNLHNYMKYDLREARELDLTKTYRLNWSFRLSVGDNVATITKKVSGNIYIDSMSIQAQKKVGVGFESKDYDKEWLNATHDYRVDGENRQDRMKYSVVSLP